MWGVGGGGGEGNWPHNLASSASLAGSMPPAGSLGARLPATSCLNYSMWNRVIRSTEARFVLQDGLKESSHDCEQTLCRMCALRMKGTSQGCWGGGEHMREQTRRVDVGFEVLTPVVMKSYIFWNATPCTSLNVSRRFGGTFRLHLQVRRTSQVRNRLESRCQAGLCQFLKFLRHSYNDTYPYLWWSLVLTA
jgi:hypothetical protein